MFDELYEIGDQKNKQDIEAKFSLVGKFSNQKTWKNESGFSLVHTIIGIFIATVGILFSFQTIDQSTMVEGYSSDELSKQAIKRTILEQLSCSHTLNTHNGNCTPGALIELRSIDNSVFVKNRDPATRMGKFTLRAECNATGNGIWVRAARLHPRGSIRRDDPNRFFKDPLTGQVETWSSEKTLLFDLKLSQGNQAGEYMSLCSNSAGKNIEEFSIETRCRSCQEQKVAQGYRYCAVSEVIVGTNHDTDAFRCTVDQNAERTWTLTSVHHDRTDALYFKCSMYCMR